VSDKGQIQYVQSSVPRTKLRITTLNESKVTDNVREKIFFFSNIVLFELKKKKLCITGIHYILKQTNRKLLFCIVIIFHNINVLILVFHQIKYFFQKLTDLEIFNSVI